MSHFSICPLFRVIVRYRQCASFFFLVLSLSASSLIEAQSVVSVRAGIVHFSEGTVLLDGRQMEQHFGRFEYMAIGSELRTENGHAEIILTPGAFLRVGENSTIRMISNRLSDSKIELLKGSLVLDSTAGTEDSPITLRFGDYEARAQTQGYYRFDSNPPKLKVDSGQMAVFHGSSEAVMLVAGHTIAMRGGVLNILESQRNSDDLDTWNNTRNNSIAEKNVSSLPGKDLSTVVDDWKNDPAALLNAINTSGLTLPSSSRTLSQAGPSSIYTTGTSPLYALPANYPLSTYNPLLGNLGLSLLPYGTWGLSYGAAFNLYMPLVLRLAYPAGISAYRSIFSPNPIGIGRGFIPSYTPRTPIRPLTPAPGRGMAIGHR
jgi:hypothetical protein